MQGLKCRDILLTYVLLVHDNRLKEKSDKIVDISVGKRNIIDNFNMNYHVEQYKCRC